MKSIERKMIIDIKSITGDLRMPVLLSLTIILFVGVVALIGDPFRTGGQGASLYWAGMETFIILLLPVAPIVYGWKTADKNGAIIIGMLPIIGIAFIGTLAAGTKIGYALPSTWIRSVAYFGSLSVIGGLEGYLAAKKEVTCILMAIGLGILWILTLLSGIH